MLMAKYIEDTAYQYQILDKSKRLDVINMMTQSFCDHEPMTKYINVTYDEFTPFAETIVDKAIADKLSIVALKDNLVVACTVVEDLVDPAPLDLNVLTPKFKFIFNLLETISSPFFADKQLNKNQVAHLFITAVHPQFYGKGLSRQVNFQSMKIANNRNYPFMLSELTNWYNEKGLIKYLEHPKRLLGTSVYNDYSLEGVYPFRGLAGSANSYLWALRKDAAIECDGKEGRQIITL
jgi:hypothetical protein